MDTQSLSNVLQVLRIMAERKGQGETTQSVIKRLAEGNTLNDVTTLKIAGHILEQIRLAEAVIANSSMREEAKAGVAQVLLGLRRAFSLTALQTPWESHVPDPVASISNFVILMDAANIPEPPKMPDEVSDLLSEMNDLWEQLSDSELDPVVRTAAKQHLQILATLLRHLPIFGIESAMASYFEMMTRVRRAGAGSSTEAQKNFVPLWDRMVKWSSRIGEADKVWNAGAKVMEHGDKLGGLLDYIPL